MSKRNSLLAAAFLTMTLLCAVPAASACGSGLDERCTYPDASSGPIQPGGPVDCAAFDPGEPGGGVLGLTQWYAGATAHSTCTLGAAAQDAALQQAGDMAWTVGSAAVGALSLVNASSIAAALPAYQANLSAVAASQAYDTCFVVLGPFCGSDTAVDQTQRCPNGVTIPNPVPGSLTGNTLENGNGALQATCPVVAAVNGSAPDGMEAAGFVNATQATLVGQALGLAGLPGTVGAAGFQYANETLANLCIYLTEDNPCIMAANNVTGLVVGVVLFVTNETTKLVMGVVYGINSVVTPLLVSLVEITLSTGDVAHQSAKTIVNSVDSTSICNVMQVFIDGRLGSHDGKPWDLNCAAQAPKGSMVTCHLGAKFGDAPTPSCTM